MRFRVCSIVLLLALVPARANEVSHRKQLDDACDDLRKAAVKSTYGWGWASDLAPMPDRKSDTPDVDFRTTAATGLLLHLAGKELDRVPHTGAAIEAARAMAATQFSTGQIPATARLLPRPGAHVDSVGIVPDRSATAAALSMMLIVIEANHAQPDQRLVSSATRAATWLSKQQTAAGGWQSAYPPGAGPKARRLIRLDDPSYRDATLALFLASKVLARKDYATAADRSIEQLLRLRIKDEASPGKRIWESTFTLSGDPVKDIEEFPRGMDLLASRYSMETLLGARLIVPHKKLDEALALAAIAAGALPKTNGQWQQRYHLFLKVPTARINSSEPDAGEPVEESFDSATFARVLAAANVQKAPDIGHFTPTERLAQTICRLSDEALYLAQPVLKAPATQPVSKSEARSSELPDALIRAWRLLLKVNQEQRKK